MDPSKMYFLLKMGIFHGYVSLPEGKSKKRNMVFHLHVFSYPLFPVHIFIEVRVFAHLRSNEPQTPQGATPHHPITTSGAEWSKRFFPKPPFFWWKGPNFVFVQGKKTWHLAKNANVTFLGWWAIGLFRVFWGGLRDWKNGTSCLLRCFLQIQKKKHGFAEHCLCKSI